FLPPTEVQGARLQKTLLAEGCSIADAVIFHSVVGIRSIIGSQVVMRDTVMMGADYYETDDQRSENRQLGRPDIGIGSGSIIESAILDKKVRIGRNVKIRHLSDRPDSEEENWAVRDGLVVVPKSAIIPDDTVI
ncbi:MAG: glucose-1-phosphate adenylyltransferase, partial [Desulfobacterales bacterium]|nr:glucose-1-phosphate adenylyltransferase [Desulfobacterales bacterium]